MIDKKPKIHYVVLTCQKNADRRESIERTWLKGQNFTFLSDQYGTPDGYGNVALKYISYFRDFANIRHDIEWYYFSDDDAHVYPKKLEKYLSTLDFRQPLAAGYHLYRLTNEDELRGDVCPVYLEGIHYLAGGPGFAVSNRAMMKLFSYLFTHRNPPWHFYGDFSFGFWLRDVDVELIYLDEHFYGAENAKWKDHSPEQIKLRYAYHYIPPHEQDWMYSLS
jgi:Galactosyltransferase